MSSATALFHSLLGTTDWSCLAPAVQRMHAEGSVIQASGEADVDGARHAFARCLRRLLTLPGPGRGQHIALTIERHATHEQWTRRFARGCMRSTLHPGGSTALRDELGPVALHFRLRCDDGAIDWQLCRVTLLGLPLPRALCGQVLSRSGAQD
ncbi:MAG: DUF4166 domain-containing protein, partial [Dyella sp.]